MNHVEIIKIVLTDALNLGRRGENLQLSSALLGALPELDSLALTTVLIHLEEQFDFKIQDDEIDGQVFETLGSLANYVAQKISR